MTGMTGSTGHNATGWRETGAGRAPKWLDGHAHAMVDASPRS